MGSRSHTTACVGGGLAFQPVAYAQDSAPGACGQGGVMAGP